MTSTSDNELTFTVEQIVRRTFTFHRGCQDGKMEFLRFLGIEHPEEFLDKGPVEIAARFQYRGDWAEAVGEARSYDMVRRLNIPGVSMIRTNGESGEISRWTTATLTVEDEAAFWNAIGSSWRGDNEVDVTDYDDDLGNARCLMRFGAPLDPIVTEY